MVKLDRIYTRGGDQGETSLGDASRVSKSDPQIAACGGVEEANAAIGCARLHASNQADEMLGRIQNDLFDLGADLCLPFDEKKKETPLRITGEHVKRLEDEIDTLNLDLSPLSSFILPGGCSASAYIHLARTIVRRTECLLVSLAQSRSINPLSLHYLNRLSDFLFVLARTLNEKGQNDVLWEPGKNV
jgi:cob(I)alamin adenosyltransferase